jgi:hypothetical protein
LFAPDALNRSVNSTPDAPAGALTEDVLTALARQSYLVSGTDGVLRLGPADAALAFEQKCVSCDAEALGALGVGCLALLVLISFSPTLGLAAHHVRQLRMAAVAQPAAQKRAAAWPTRPRSLAALGALQLGLCLMMLCVTPWLLSALLDTYLFLSAELLACSPLGAVCAMLVLRSDDLYAVRLVRALVACVSGLLAASLAPLALNDLSFFTSPSTHPVEYLRGRDFELNGEGLYVTFVLHAIYLPQACVYGAMTALCATLSMLQLYSLAMCGSSSVVGQRQLWGSVRVVFGCIALVLLLGVGLIFLAINRLGNPNYPAERRLLDSNVRTWLMTSASAALATALTTPRLRLLLHLGWPRVSPNVRTGSRSRVELRRTIAAQQKRSDTTPVLDRPAALPTHTEQTHCDTSAAASVTPHAPLDGCLKDVDRLALFDDVDGRFDGLVLGMKLGEGGFARVCADVLAHTVRTFPPHALLSAHVVCHACVCSCFSYAAHTAHEPHLAVKVFDSRAATVGGVLEHLATRELAILRKLSHHRIVEVLGSVLLREPTPEPIHPATNAQTATCGHAYRLPGLVMRNPGGGTLHALLAAGSDHRDVDMRRAARPYLTSRLQLSLAMEVAEGLAFLHSKHITHRDLKPRNVLLTAGHELHAQSASLVLLSPTLTYPCSRGLASRRVCRVRHVRRVFRR